MARRASIRGGALAATVAIAVVLLTPAGAGSYELFPGGPFWSGNPAVIKYHSKLNRKREPSLKKAIAAWNHSGVDIKLKSSSAGEADLTFKPWRNVPCGNGFTGPFVPNGKVKVLLGARPAGPRGTGDGLQVHRCPHCRP